MPGLCGVNAAFGLTMLLSSCSLLEGCISSLSSPARIVVAGVSNLFRVCGLVDELAMFNAWFSFGVEIVKGGYESILAGVLLDVLAGVWLGKAALGGGMEWLS